MPLPCSRPVGKGLEYPGEPFFQEQGPQRLVAHLCMKQGLVLRRLGLMDNCVSQQLLLGWSGPQLSSSPSMLVPRIHLSWRMN